MQFGFCSILFPKLPENVNKNLLIAKATTFSHSHLHGSHHTAVTFLSLKVSIPLIMDAVLLGSPPLISLLSFLFFLSSLCLPSHFQLTPHTLPLHHCFSGYYLIFLYCMSHISILWSNQFINYYSLNDRGSMRLRAGTLLKASPHNWLHDLGRILMFSQVC